MKQQHITPARSLTKETEALLNAQIVMEGKSSAAYLSMASWCETKGYDTAGGHARQPEISGIKHTFASLREVFELVLHHELDVTKSINNIVDQCFQIKDFATFNFLQWFVMEQREEETLARRAVELFDLIGEEGVGLWMIDQEIGKLEAFASKVTANQGAQ